MLQANQKQVIQSTNMTLIEIRTAEISYFSVFFNNFGLQTSIISGAICGSLSQTPALHGYDCPWSFVFLYFTSAAAALTISLYAILSALFLIVYGNGYALRGPLGSMVQTIDGMIFEQHTIVVAFVFSMVFYVISMASMFMVVMDDFCGPISFGIAMIGGFITYSHCLRIFNRFRFVNPLSRWADDDEDPMKQFEEDNPEEKLKLNKEIPGSVGSHRTGGTGGNRSELSDKGSSVPGSETGSVSDVPSRAATAGVAPTQNPMKKNKIAREPSILSRFLNLATSADFAFQYAHNGTTDNSSRKQTQPSAKSTSNSATTALAAGAAAAGATVELSLPEGSPETYYHHLALVQSSTMEGYLTVKSIVKRRFSLNDPWSRKYIVLKGRQIFLYPTRQAFQQHPEQPINLRPIHLDGYSLAAGANAPPYSITLTPVDPNDIREPWQFRCDTLYEFETWMDRFARALQLAATDDLVVYKGGVKSAARGGGVDDAQSVTSAVTTHSYL